MKALFILPVLISLTAFARSDTRSMSCSDAQSYIQQKGRAVLQTCGEFAYFSSMGCPHGQAERAGYVVTKDSSMCYVGSYCVTAGRGNPGGPYIQDGGDTCQ